MISLASVFERIRQKPETVRVRYLFFSVGVSFLCIVALWAFSLHSFFGALFKNFSGGAVDTVRENARNIQESAPASLEDLLKAGKTLKEGMAEQPPSEATHSSTPETSDFLPGSAATMTNDDATDTTDTATGSLPTDVSPVKGSDTAHAPSTEHAAADVNQ